MIRRSVKKLRGRRLAPLLIALFTSVLLLLCFSGTPVAASAYTSEEQEALDRLEEEVEELFKALALHNAANRIPEWKKKYEGMPFEKLVYLLRDELNSEAFEALLRALG